LSGQPVDRTEIAAFVAIATLASAGEVFRLGQATMFDSNDVIYFAAEESIIEVNQAILAEVFGAGDAAMKSMTSS
jgi:hypothetical protein